MTENAIHDAASLIRTAGYTVVFTGAGISVESGVPPFRGSRGVWSTYDPKYVTIRYFHKHPAHSWKMIREIFFDSIAGAKPNAAHRALAELERKGFVHSIITQNIDNLHQKAGSRRVYEYHGTIKTLVCTECYEKFSSCTISLTNLPPACPVCSGILKPDFVFFGESIPDEINWQSTGEAESSDVMLVVGTAGTVKPASLIPYAAKRARAKIIEVNISQSAYTQQITDIFLRGKATDILTKLAHTVIDF